MNALLADLEDLLDEWNALCDFASDASVEILSGDELSFCITDIAELIAKHRPDAEVAAAR